MEKRVVITGYGALTSVGNSVAETWDALINGKCGIDRITHFDCTEFRSHVAGEVKNFDPLKYMTPKEAKRMDRFCQLAMAASLDALTSAGLPWDLRETDLDLTRIGVLVSSGVGGLQTITDQVRLMSDKGPSRSSPMMIPMMIIDLASGNISIRTGAGGPNMGLVTACSSGCHSIGEAMWMIKRGDADMMLAGGSEAAVTDVGVAGFSAMKALSTRNDDPQHASRPFDLNRDGFVIAEGAGVLVLEELEHAKRRGAKILAELIGYGASADAYHITSPLPDGSGAARAMIMAMNHAGIKPEEVDYINAHGTSTELNDKYETKAIRLAFGEAADRLSVSSTKGATGHALGAAGGIESIVCVKTIETGIIPPTINYETPDPECDLDITPNAAKKRDVRIALNTNLGFGGHNGALLFKRFED